MPTPDRWEVEDLGNETFDVRHNGRAVDYDRDRDEVKRILERYGVTEYVYIEHDGWRSTKRL
jgi:sugar phosphate isomerase/epimerase